MSGARFVEAKLGELPFGTMVYNEARIPLGIIRKYRVMNGDRASIPERHLDNGRPADRFAYRRRAMYRAIEEAGGRVWVIER